MGPGRAVAAVGVPAEHEPRAGRGRLPAALRAAPGRAAGSQGRSQGRSPGRPGTAAPGNDRQSGDETLGEFKESDST